jgi:hypothetical protein
VARHAGELCAQNPPRVLVHFAEQEQRFAQMGAQPELDGPDAGEERRDAHVDGCARER